MREFALVLIQSDPAEGLRRLASLLRSGFRVDSVYIEPARCGTVHGFGRQLHEMMTTGTEKAKEAGGAFPSLTPEEETAVRNLRGSYAFRAAHDPRVSLQTRPEPGGWTVVCEEDSLFASSCAPRQLYVKPVPAAWEEVLFHVRPHLGGALVWPWDEATVATLRSPLRLARVSVLDEPR